VRVAITGGAGFIGANLARTLLDDERIDGVAIVDDLSTGRRENLEGLDVDLHVGTILDPAVLDATFDGVEAIVHLAARPSVPRSLQDPVASHHANATGTIEVLEAARRIGRPHVIVASSSSVYGANPTLPKSEDLRTQPLSPYAVSKLATETYALAYAYCFELPVLAFRFFNVFGPLQPAGHAYAAALPAFIDAALRGQPIPIDGDGGADPRLHLRRLRGRGDPRGDRAPADLRRAGQPGVRDPALDPGRGGGARGGVGGDARARAPSGPSRRRAPLAGRRHPAAELLPDVEPVDFRIGLEATVAWFRTLAGLPGPDSDGGPVAPAAEAAFGATEARPPLRAVPDGP
jgi:UDP-glucose 4-epimerase